MSAPAPRVSAPGKLFLAGEYGVLGGGAAVVAAVDRRVTGFFRPGGAPATPLVAEAMRLTRAHLAGVALPDGAPVVDSAALSTDDAARGARKLGLGSSAAAAAVSVGALLAAAGRDPAADPALAFALAEAAHRAAQGGRGSGADVAAAVYGGVILYARAPGETARVQPLGPAPVEVIAFSAGAPRATVDGIRAVEALAARAPALHAARMNALAGAAGTFARAWETTDAAGVVAAARAAGEALAALGADAGIAIWTDPVRTADHLAADLGGAAKPSGAGGGDVGVAFLPDAAAAAAFRARALGLDLLPLRIGAPGLRQDT